MAKTIFEEMGGTYTQVGDYLLPDLKLPEEEQQPIGVWGRCHTRYLKEHRRATYCCPERYGVSNRNGLLSYRQSEYFCLCQDSN